MVTTRSGQEASNCVTERCDLVVIGAGYAGINALNAAAKYLPKGARVVVIAREKAWGGMWVDAYDFVRLHAPYQTFTAGERNWELKKPHRYQATKKEILAHFENIKNLCAKEKDLDIVELFEYEYLEHATRPRTSADGGSAVPKVVEVKSRALRPAREGAMPMPQIKVIADKMIRATGFNVQIKQPLKLGTNKVHTLAPTDVISPEWNAKLRFSEDSDKPIWVIGSGKTAMDVINYLCNHIPGAKERIHCVSGHGTAFQVRDPPEGFFNRWMNKPNTQLDNFVKIIQMFDGSNAPEVFVELEKRGFIHSALPTPDSFSLGVCSRAEIAIAKAALTPHQDKVVKAYIRDVVDGPDGPVMEFSALDSKIKEGKEEKIHTGGGLITGAAKTFERKLPEGSFIVNATEHIALAGKREFQPIIDEDGIVLCPQMLCGFTGPTANLVVHAWYLGVLEPMWRHLPRAEIGPKDQKVNGGILGLMIILLGTTCLQEAIRTKWKGNPINFQDHFQLKQPNDVPMPRLILAFLRLQAAMPDMLGKFTTTHGLHGRYTDNDPKAPKTDGEADAIILKRIALGNAAVDAELSGKPAPNPGAFFFMIFVAILAYLAFKNGFGN
mmetsp:Transcript_11331/g.13390  ORF Transcript_11331/g.13390 Transcript_11331/m.13390 type:complete len:610 (+) Transcript_11331:95-1924(+)|eukprot:CAMPEP_0197844140 /NCGR_PEP_ID=MMETSP1438-20131217/1125_1 /TAXON_ID=1461541 /ORGANISM="Pterosperma sp., Strain CCMP1384" /LENGTH=609 /DNA_ID=CAMNT_0043454761 /DNA_START=94 /DNA_END=1923 /DNA_ORIENTATION=-